MKDGFDRSVAERMPRMQKRRPNRPWNVDPVLIRPQEEIKEQLAPAPEAAPEQVAAPVQDAATESAVHPEVSPVISRESAVNPAVSPVISRESASEAIAKAVESIEDLSTEFSQILFEKKDIVRRLKEHDRVIEEIGRENSSLKVNLVELEMAAQQHNLLEREILFLNEQLEDADHYIQHVVGMLDEKTRGFDAEMTRSRLLEDKITRFSRDIQEKAKLDVKVSILEKDLGISTARIHELETRLEEEYHKRKPLEDEIAELKVALDRVYSSLSHIRLKAKREVYGS